MFPFLFTMFYAKHCFNKATRRSKGKQDIHLLTTIGKLIADLDNTSNDKKQEANKQLRASSRPNKRAALSLKFVDA